MFVIKIILSPSILEPVSISKGLRKKKGDIKIFLVKSIKFKVKIWYTEEKKRKKTVVRTFN